MSRLRVVRPAERDRDVTAALIAAVERTNADHLAIWTPEPHLSVGPRDRAATGFPAVEAVAAERGYPVRVRRMGGHPVLVTERTLALVWSTLGDRGELQERYRAVQECAERALASLGVPVRVGEPPRSFCPGTHSLRASGKIAGFAQRIRRDVAAVGGIVIVDGAEGLATDLEAIYAALELPFDPSSVDSVAGAGGPVDPEVLRDALVDAFRRDSSEPSRAPGRNRSV